MIDYDSFSRCHLTDIFFRYSRGSKRVKDVMMQNTKFTSNKMQSLTEATLIWTRHINICKRYKHSAIIYLPKHICKGYFGRSKENSATDKLSFVINNLIEITHTRFSTDKHYEKCCDSCLYLQLRPKLLNKMDDVNVYCKQLYKR